MGCTSWKSLSAKQCCLIWFVFSLSITLGGGGTHHLALGLETGVLVSWGQRWHRGMAKATFIEKLRRQPALLGMRDAVRLTGQCILQSSMSAAGPNYCNLQSFRTLALQASTCFLFVQECNILPFISLSRITTCSSWRLRMLRRSRLMLQSQN